MTIRMMRLAEVWRCRRVRRVLQAYLDGQVDAATAAEVERHLAACRRCGGEAAVYAEIRRALARRGARVDEVAVRRLRTFASQLPGSAERQ